MALRIAVGGFLHESHSFAPRPTGWAEFVQPGGLPPLRSGPAMLDAARGTSVALAGALAEMAAAGATPVPLTWCFANPAGPVEDQAFERIAALICAGLVGALESGPLDGVYLDLHGAAMAESFPDAEGELLRRVPCRLRAARQPGDRSRGPWAGGGRPGILAVPAPAPRAADAARPVAGNGWHRLRAARAPVWPARRHPPHREKPP